MGEAPTNPFEAQKEALQSTENKESFGDLLDQIKPGDSDKDVTDKIVTDTVNQSKTYQNYVPEEGDVDKDALKKSQDGYNANVVKSGKQPDTTREFDTNEE